MNLSQRFISVIWCWFLIGSAFVFAQSSNKYEFAKLSYLASKMNSGNLPASSGLFSYPALADSKIVLKYNPSGHISHLGISLFNDDTKKVLDVKACNFMERFFLELALLQTPELVNAKLKEFKCDLFVNGRKLQSTPFISLISEIQQNGNKAEFSLQQNSELWEAVWKYGSPTKEITFSFPNYRELVEGTDKKEADMAVYEAIVKNQNQSITLTRESAPEASLLEKEGAIYILRGVKALENTYTSDEYYVKDKQNFIPLFTSNYPNYALANVFQIPSLSGKFVLKIRHEQYGKQSENATISLPAFQNLFKSDFDTYSFVREDKKGMLEAYVIINHKRLNYMHLLQLSVNPKELFSGKEQIVMDAVLRTNVPQHYIKTLVDDKIK